MVMGLFRKKQAMPMMLFGDPVVGMELGRLIARRQERRERMARVDWMLEDFCSRPAAELGRDRDEEI